MKATLKTMLVVAMMAMMATGVWAKNPKECPADYYKSALNKNQEALLSALYDIIGSHTNIGYDGLWEAYADTDTGSDGYYIDMYSNYDKFTYSKKCGNYSKVGDCVNREHSFPKSWWGSGKDNRYSDIFHLYPTDGYVNNQRSNYPFGECANGTRLQNGNYYGKGKKGSSTFSGYSGTVFEPDDEYKGDFARSYFYMAAAYYASTGWTGDMLKGSSNHYPFFSDWAINLLLKWHRQDPVSEKEIKRNNYAYAWQNNRNPFIDHPELAEYIWGDKKTEKWTGSADVTPALIAPATGDRLDLGIVHTGKSVSRTVSVQASNLTKAVTVSVTGTGFSVSPTSITAANANAGTTITVTYTSATAAEATGTFTVSSTEFTAVTVDLTAEAVAGIVAQRATDITQTSFIAHWENTDESTGNYLLYVKDATGAGVNGFSPKTVSAAALSQVVTGLTQDTDYTYYLVSATDASFKSNTISVSTEAAPKIIDIIADEGALDLTALVGTASPIAQAQVYTEYITEDILLEVTGNFEISLDKEAWAKTLTIDADGESFYLRIASTDATGDFSGILSASTATLDGVDVDVTASVLAAAAAVVEGWESSPRGGGFITGTIQGDMCVWDVDDACVYASANDHPRGTQAMRLGRKATSSIAMAQDKTGGVGEISFYAASYGYDDDASLTVLYSVDGGKTWTELTGVQAAAVTQRAPATRRNAVAVSQGTLKRYICQADIDAPAVRIKIQQTAGARVNIDDIALSDYGKSIVTAVKTVGVDGDAWDAHAGRGTIALEGRGVTAQVYDMDARQVAAVKLNGKTTVDLPAGVYVVVVDNRSKKVIVK